MRAPGWLAPRVGELLRERALQCAYEWELCDGLSLLFSFRATAMLLILVHQIDLALEAFILESLPFEIEFDLSV